MGGLKKVGILVFVLSVFSSCGVNKSTEDSKKANETKVEQIATLSAGTPVQSLDPANSSGSNKCYIVGQRNGRVVPIR